MADDNSQVISTAVSTVGNYAASVAANKRQWKYQQRAMEKQQQYNKDLWDYQNAYNTPQQQMARYQAAGLNPHLIYGSGAQASGNAGPIAPTEVPSQKAATLAVPDIYREKLVTRQMDAQYAATLQNIENQRVNASLQATKASLENLRLMREENRSKNYEELNQAEKRTLQAIADRTEWMGVSEREKAALMDQLHIFRNQANPLQVEKLKGEIKSQELENAFKQNRNQLAELGIYSSDNALLRILVQASHRTGLDLGYILSQGANKLQYLIELAK